jgi:NAD(P)-dependent dehydrogenase (short-subunit alcohol dehydrogenase family)
MNKGFSLDGKNIILTGAAGILGTHLAQEYLNFGGNLYLIDINEGLLQEKLKVLRAQSKGNVEGFAIDLTNEAQVNSTIDSIFKSAGSIDVLHNNAASKGSSLDEFLKPFEDYSVDTWNQIMESNVTSMFLMAKAVGAKMKETGGGSIIQTGSIYGIMGPDKRIYEGSEYNGKPISSPAVYSASKAAVDGLTKYLAAYWGEYKIRVNTLTPGGINSGQNDHFAQKYSQRVPLARMASENDLLGAAIFLASSASEYITGQNIVVDGGLSCW